MNVQVLGTGCAKCRQLLANAEKAVRDAGVEAAVEKVQDIREILRFGVISTPALAIDGKVKAAGRVLSPEEIRKLLEA